MPVSTMSRAFSSPVPTLAQQASKSSTRSVTHRLSEQLTLEEVTFALQQQQILSDMGPELSVH